SLGIPVATLLQLKLADFEVLAGRGLIGLATLRSGLTVTAEDLVAAGLVTASQLVAAGLSATGPVAVAALVLGGLVSLGDLAAAKLIDVSSLVPGATVPLGVLLTAGAADLRKLIAAQLLGANDLIVSKLDLRDLIRSGLVQLHDLAVHGLLDRFGLQSLGIDPRQLMAKLAVAAPSRILMNVDLSTTTVFEGFAQSQDLESRVTRSVAIGDLNGDGRND